jgi:hypothetical protein
MEKTGTRQVVPRLRASDKDMPSRPWIDQFSSGYMQRMMHRFPKQGDREPWINPQNYWLDRKMIRFGALGRCSLQRSRPSSDACRSVRTRRSGCGVDSTVWHRNQWRGGSSNRQLSQAMAAATCRRCSQLTRPRRPRVAMASSFLSSPIGRARARRWMTRVVRSRYFANVG